MRKIVFIFLFGLLCLPLAAQEGGRSQSIVTIDAVRYYVHMVEPGQTLYGLSRTYGVAEDVIKANNPHAVGGLQAGHVLKIPVPVPAQGEQLNRRQMKRTFDTHTIAAGETLSAISRRYGISVATLMDDNRGLDPVKLRPGQTINIRKSDQGETTGWEITEELEEYRDAINSVTNDGVYHLVQSGETIYGLSKMYSVSEDEIRAANDLSGGLKAGALIKIPTLDGQLRGGVQIADEGVQPQPQTPVLPVREPERGRAQEGTGAWVKDISSKRSVNVSLLLPLRNDKGQTDSRFIDFYKGVMLGLEDLKAEGISSRLSVYNTTRSADEVSRITETAEFQESDIVIGPIYEEGLTPVLYFAERKGVPVVSPLGTHGVLPSPVLYQMPPADDTKFEKLRVFLSQPDINVIYVSTQYPDKDMEEGLRPYVPVGTKFIDFKGGVQGSVFGQAYDRRAKENVFVVSCDREYTADEVLANISSVQSNLTSRSLATSGVRVVAGSRWNRFDKIIDHELFFKLGVCYVANYHADRGSTVVRDLDARYIAAYGTEPSLYSYRGYDAAKLFAGAAMTPGENFTRKLNSYEGTLLQTRYNMVQRGHESDFRNNNWVMVCFHPDFTIEVK